MRAQRMIRGTALAAVVVALWAGCGGGTDAGPDPLQDGSTDSGAGDSGTDGGDPDSGSQPDGGDSGTQPNLVWQPGYRTALRASDNLAAPTTFRMKIRSVRAGARLRFSFRAGAGALTLFKANVAKAGVGGDLVGSPVAVTFGGVANKALAAGSTAVSDPVNFAVARNDELYVSFELQGSAAITGLLDGVGVNLMPGSFRKAGQFADVPTGFAGTAESVQHALVGMDVEGEQQKLVLAIGDSITEGYVGGSAGSPDDYRDSWPSVASSLAAPPMVSASVSGQGVLGPTGALANVSNDVLQVSTVTDCILLIGTNDLQASPGNASIVPNIEAAITQLVTQIQSKCTVWVATLLPKESVGTSGSGITLTEVRARRTELNTWIRSQPQWAGRVIDMDAAVRDTSAPENFQAQYRYDGIHPSVAGQAKLGQVASAALQ